MPMERERYPADWERIATAKKESVGWRCERCGKQCRKPGEPFDTHRNTLTVAHLNHTPEDVRPENLCAMCARAICGMMRNTTRKQEEGGLTMDLISKKAAVSRISDLLILELKGKRIPTWNEVHNAIGDIPSVPAVPLDRLCEWLETDCLLSCVSCERLFGGQWCKQHPELPYRCHRKEHWKDALTKWMEEQDAAD